MLFVNAEVDFLYRFTTYCKKFMMSPRFALVSSYGIDFYFVYFARFNLLAVPKFIA